MCHSSSFRRTVGKMSTGGETKDAAAASIPAILDQVKLAAFHPKARDTIRDFPEDVRRDFGKAIFDLRKGAKLAVPLARDVFHCFGCGGVARQGSFRRVSSFLLHQAC